MPQDDNSIDVRRYLTLALIALPHGGQESAGMAVYESNRQSAHRIGMGKGSGVFSATETGLPFPSCGSGHVL